MMYLFHLTKYENFDSIQKNGIMPNFTKGFAKNSAYDKNCVWLTDSPLYIIENQVGDRYLKKYDVRVLKVNVSRLEIYSRICHYFLKPSIHEFVCFQTIPSKFILNLNQ